MVYLSVENIKQKEGGAMTDDKILMLIDRFIILLFLLIIFKYG